MYTVLMLMSLLQSSTQRLQNKMKSLSPRLMAVARFIRHGKRVADIGTDHGYLPVYLAENGISDSIIAADLRVGPLENARQNVEAAGLEGRISLRLSDGLQAFSAQEADEISIAGMGGILIAQIMEQAPWLKADDKHLVLQPMSHPEVLREFLMKNGYNIIEETICEDSGKLYCVMSVAFSGEKAEYPKHYEYYGEIPSCKEPLAKEYLSRLGFRLSRDADSMRCADPVRADKLYSVSEKIECILSNM